MNRSSRIYDWDAEFDQCYELVINSLIEDKFYGCPEDSRYCYTEEWFYEG